MADTLPVARVEVLPGTDDVYMGILVDAAALPADPAEFSERLQHSLQAWKARERKGIWLKVPAHKSALIPPAVAAGFDFHHAEKDYVMMTKWLADTENKLPANASHQVGVGAFVLNERREVLVVQELNGPLRGKGVWKMPTGLVNAGEDIHTAAEREVLEETGVRAKFDSVLAVRQSHGFAFGKSDFFFVMALRPEEGQTQLVKQEDELEAVQWMPIEEYAAIPFTATRPLFKVIIDRCVAYSEGRFRGFRGQVLDNSFGGKVRHDLLVYGEDDAPRQAEDPAGSLHKL
ncbi:hypothetical protein WJX72_008756 [[Myrmecia] bisecta]|uniref:Nudix hydrolase domain-containing protein n=1 Tax=[Myrmecia] bisecta TaxID=41462 RepID=A0AAW1QFW9_9CHLO